MEINELKYFLQVAETENLNRAADFNSISAGTLSKAISRLEADLGIKLFERVGRNIQLSEAGKELQKRSMTLLREIEDIKLSIAGPENSLNISIYGEEVLMSNFSSPLIQRIVKKYPNANFELNSIDSKLAMHKLDSREANIVFSTIRPSNSYDYKVIEEVEFKTCISKAHPLYNEYTKKRKIDVKELLKNPFVVPKENFLGRTKEMQSTDGWRDDQFPRKFQFKVSSLKTLESLLLSGQALAFIPDYLAKSLDVTTINVQGCSYVCKQKVYQIARDSKEYGWLNQIW